MVVDHAGWRGIKGFYVDMGSDFRPTDNGPYNIDTSLQADQLSIVVPITGIYLISASVTIHDPKKSKFQVAIFDAGHSTKHVSPTSIHKFHAGEDHTISLSSFIKLFAGEVLVLMIYSPLANYTVTETTSLTFHYVGGLGSIPAYLANVETIVEVASGGIVKPWVTEGRGKLFRSLYGKIIYFMPGGYGWLYLFTTGSRLESCIRALINLSDTAFIVRHIKKINK